MKILNLTVNEFMNGLEHVIEYVHWEHEGIKGSTKLNPQENFFTLSKVLQRKKLFRGFGQLIERKLKNLYKTLKNFL